MMIRKSTIFLAIATGTLLTACNSMEGGQDDSRTPIRLTTGIQPTRATTTQDIQLLAGQDVYCWAKQGDDAYFDAWRLTANGTGGFSSQSSTQYYPNGALTLYCTHGNFQPAVVEEVTAMPSSLLHQVKTDQSLQADYAKSDLLYYYEAGVTASAEKQITLANKLSKIVVQLEDGNSGSDYSAAELAKAEVRLLSVNPEITMVLDASGTLPTTVSAGTTTIKPYQASASEPSFEAIIPCNQVKPATLIQVTLNGQTATLNPTAPEDAAKFEGGKKYTYTVTVSKTAITVAVAGITDWTDYDGGTAITDLPAQSTIDVRRNPLWYVAKANLAAGGTAFSTIGSTSQGYCWFWANAMTLGYTYNTTGYDGYAIPATPKPVTNSDPGSTWHMPTHMEWVSIVPGTAGFDVFSPANYSGETVITEPACSFGYNNDTKYGKGNTSNPATPTGTKFKSVWSTYNNDSLRFAIRFLGTPYCSVWKYQYLDYGTTQGRLVISSRLIDQINPDETDRLAAMLTTIQSADFDWSDNERIGAVQRVFYATGYQTGVEGAAPGGSIPYKYGGWWAATKLDTDRGWRLDANGNGDAYLNVGGSDILNPRTVRLFRDNPDIMKNPLFYVAEYNMTNSAVGSGVTLTMAASDNAGYYYSWADAMSTFAASTSSYDGYKKGNKVISGISDKTWHLPTLSELYSINPILEDNYDIIKFGGESGYRSNYRTAIWGYNFETKTVGVEDNLYYVNVSSDETHVLRFLGTPYCSAWKYINSGNLFIYYATLIEPIENSEAAASAFYNSKWSSIYFGNDASKGAISRKFYKLGIGKTPSSSIVDQHYESYMYLWSTTRYNSENCYFLWNRNVRHATSGAGTDNYTFPVRLFLDN